MVNMLHLPMEPVLAMVKPSPTHALMSAWVYPQYGMVVHSRVPTTTIELTFKGTIGCLVPIHVTMELSLEEE